MSDLRQSEEWAKYLVSQGWEVEELKVSARGATPAGLRPRGSDSRSGQGSAFGGKNVKCKIFIRKIPLLGSVIKIQRPPAIPPVEKIDKIAKRHKALFVKFEPSLSTINYEQLTINDFSPDPAPCLSTKSTVVDLTKSEEELWKTLSQDTRHDIKDAERNQVPVIGHQPGDSGFGQALGSFSHLLSETGRRQGFWAPNFKQLKSKTKAFGKNATLLLAYPPSLKASEGQAPSPNRPIAGFLILTHDGVAYYQRTATSIAGRELNAAYLLMWETIKMAKRLGLKALDLGSIYDPRYHKATKSWQNFGTFKKKWRGYEVEYPVPLVKCYRPLGKLFHKLDKLQFG